MRHLSDKQCCRAQGNSLSSVQIESAIRSALAVWYPPLRSITTGTPRPRHRPTTCWSRAMMAEREICSLPRGSPARTSVPALQMTKSGRKQSKSCLRPCMPDRYSWSVVEGCMGRCLSMASLTSESQGQILWLQQSTMYTSSLSRKSRQWPLPWWASRSIIITRRSPSRDWTQWTVSEMSGQRQKPPPRSKLAWWNPPERLTAQPRLLARQAARMEPSVASSMLSSTLHLSTQPGRNQKGSSRYLHTPTPQHSCSRYFLPIFSSRNCLEGLPGVTGRKGAMFLREFNCWKMRWYLRESKGWYFSSPHRLMLQCGWQTNRLCDFMQQLAASPHCAATSYPHSSSSGYVHTQTTPASPISHAPAHSCAHSHPRPNRKHPASTTQYINNCSTFHIASFSLAMMRYSPPESHPPHQDAQTETASQPAAALQPGERGVGGGRGEFFLVLFGDVLAGAVSQRVLGVLEVSGSELAFGV